MQIQKIKLLQAQKYFSFMFAGFCCSWDFWLIKSLHPQRHVHLHEKNNIVLYLQNTMWEKSKDIMHLFPIWYAKYIYGQLFSYYSGNLHNMHTCKCHNNGKIKTKTCSSKTLWPFHIIMRFMTSIKTWLVIAHYV